MLHRKKWMIAVSRSLVGLLVSLFLLGQTVLHFHDSEAAVRACLFSSGHHSMVVNHDQSIPDDKKKEIPNSQAKVPYCCHKAPINLSFVLDRPPLIQEAILSHSLNPGQPSDLYKEVFFTPEVPPG